MKEDEPRRRSSLRRGQRVRIRRTRRWQSQHEQRAAFVFVLASDLPAVILHQAVNRTQDQACAFADRLRGIERIENSMRLTNSRAVVGKLYNDLFSLKLCADAQQSTARFLERIQSILHDLHECLKQLMAIATYLWQSRIDDDFDANFLIYPSQITHLDTALEQRAHVDQGFFSRGLLRKTQKVGDQIPRSLGLVHDLAHERVLLTREPLIRPQFL